MDSGPLARVQAPCRKGLSVSNLSGVSQRALEHVRGSEGILANFADFCGLPPPPFFFFGIMSKPEWRAVL